MDMLRKLSKDEIDPWIRDGAEEVSVTLRGKTHIAIIRSCPTLVNLLAINGYRISASLETKEGSFLRIVTDMMRAIRKHEEAPPQQELPQDKLGEAINKLIDKLDKLDAKFSNWTGLISK